MLSLCVILIQFAASFAQNAPPYKTYWFSQQLDHFDPQNLDEFQQRYLVYDGAFDKSKNVIFFYAGNEGPIDGFYNNTGFMFDIAPEFGALILFCEHRYYGKTHPFGDDFSSRSMQYLTMENAIADYAQFITTMKKKYDLPDAKVIVFGGSYGGILAALCRIHYPAIFDMALAASAPIPQTLNSVDPTIFFKLVTDDYYNVNAKCPDLVRKGYSQMIEAAQNNQYAHISDTFRLCSNVYDDAGLLYLQQWARNGLLTMAMVDYPYAADFLGKLPANPVNASCKAMLQYADNPMKALAEGAGLYYNASYDNQLSCFNITEEFIECADQTGCGLGTDATAWDYQMCTEIVYEIITNNVTDMFPPLVWDNARLIDYCQKTYGVTPDWEQMQIWFPLDLADATSRIIFSNGLLDPWHGGGYLVSPGDPLLLPTVVIPSGAHHLDLRGKNKADPEDVIKAREYEVQIFKNWLAELRAIQ